jgi:dienelactone hydrolase
MNISKFIMVISLGIIFTYSFEAFAQLDSKSLSSHITNYHENIRSSYVVIPVGNENSPKFIAGKLNFPKKKHNGTAVLIVHGSNGIDSRGILHSHSLNDQGYITLEIDLWAARGWYASIKGRPKMVSETLPDAFAAYQFLANLKEVDKEKIGLLGFSWGGVVSMLSREKSLLTKFNKKQGFAANVAFYPVCWVYNQLPAYQLLDTSQQPLLILTGEKDDYDSPSSCLRWKNSLSKSEQSSISIHVYPDAYHGFNSIAARKVVNDPFSHQGKGGEVIMQENITARINADSEVIRFFNRNLLSQ